MAETEKKLQMEEKSILLQMARVLFDEKLLTNEESVRLQQRISKE